MAKQTITAFVGKATSRRHAWAALAAVAAVAAVGCAAHAEDASRDRGSPAPETGRRVTFVAQADRACRDFDAGLRSVAASTVGDRSLVELPSQELGAFSGGLLPLADTYYRQVAALDAPSDGRDLADQLTADAYETFLLVSSLDVTGLLPPDAPFVTSAADVQAHLMNSTNVEKEFREYGFASCGHQGL